MLKQSKEAALARKGSYAPNLVSKMGSIEASWEPESDSDILEQRDCSEESIAKIQNLVTENDSDLKAVSIELVETKARKIPARAELYKVSNSLQKRIKV